MSRIGKAPITIPAGVEVTLNGQEITVKGPKGEVKRTLNPEITAEIENGTLKVVIAKETANAGALHGLNRTLVNNMIIGVTEGFKKTLEINGVGYKAAKEGTKLVLNIGYSHTVNVEETATVKIDVPNPNTVVINGIDKQEVGQFAADVRNKRPPEPYKGKGIKYDYEVIRRKEGKTGAK